MWLLASPVLRLARLELSLETLWLATTERVRRLVTVEGWVALGLNSYVPSLIS